MKLLLSVTNRRTEWQKLNFGVTVSRQFQEFFSCAREESEVRKWTITGRLSSLPSNDADVAFDSPVRHTGCVSVTEWMAWLSFIQLDLMSGLACRSAWHVEIAARLDYLSPSSIGLNVAREYNISIPRTCTVKNSLLRLLPVSPRLRFCVFWWSSFHQHSGRRSIHVSKVSK